TLSPELTKFVSNSQAGWSEGGAEGGDEWRSVSKGTPGTRVFKKPLTYWHFSAIVAGLADRVYSASSVGAWRSPVSAPVWGTGGRGFKSRRPDQHLAPDCFPENGLGKRVAPPG